MSIDFGSAKIVFWDFDGVIKESVEVKTDAYCALFRPYSTEIEEKVRAHHLSNGGMSRFDKIPLYLGWAGLDRTPEMIEEFCSRFARAVEGAVVASDWVPGVKAVLETQCRERHFVLVTATPQEEIESILHRLGIRKCFTEVFGAPATKVSGIRQTLADFGIGPELCLMIGDSREDFMAAEKCRVPFLLRRTAQNAKTMPDYSGPQVFEFE